MAIYSVAFSSPLLLKAKLVSDGYETKNILMVPPNTTLNVSRLPRVLMFATYADFRRNAKYLFTKGRAKLCFVFCDPTLSYKYIPCIEPFDWKAVKTKRDISIEKRKATYTEHKTPKFVVDEDFIEALTEEVKQGSILNSLMTAIYTIGNSQSQKGTTLLVCKWLMTPDGCTAHKLLTNASNTFSLSSTTTSRLGEILSNPLIPVFKKVFSKLNKDKSNVKELCAAQGIPPFEVNYILAKCANDIDTDKRKIDELINA